MHTMNTVLLIISAVFVAQQGLSCRVNSEPLVGKISKKNYGQCVVGTTPSPDNINFYAKSLVMHAYAHVLVQNFRNLVNFASYSKHQTHWTVECQASGFSGRHYKCQVQGDNLIFSYKYSHHVISGVLGIQKKHTFEPDAYRIERLTTEWDIEVLPGGVLQGGATTPFGVAGTQLTGAGQFTEYTIQGGLLKNFGDLLRGSCSM